MIKWQEEKLCGVISDHHRMVCCDLEEDISFLWGINPKVDIWTCWEWANKEGSEGWSNSGRRKSMYWRRTIRAQFSEQAGRAGEWDEVLLGRGGVCSWRVLMFMLRVWIFILRAMRSHQKIFEQGAGVLNLKWTLTLQHEQQKGQSGIEREKRRE